MDAETVALQLLELLEKDAYQRAAHDLLARALADTDDAPPVVELTLEYVEGVDLQRVRPELGCLAHDLGHRVADDRVAARLLAAAAVIFSLTEDSQAALGVCVDALRRDPQSDAARGLFAELAEYPDEAPDYSDAMEGLALSVRDGSFPRAAFAELLTLAASLRATLGRARALAGMDDA